VLITYDIWHSLLGGLRQPVSCHFLRNTNSMTVGVFHIVYASLFMVHLHQSQVCDRLPA